MNMLVAENEIYDCGTGGYTAGQGTGFQYMVLPWIHYEANYITFVNNVVHDTQGAGFGTLRLTVFLMPLLCDVWADVGPGLFRPPL